MYAFVQATPLNQVLEPRPSLSRSPSNGICAVSCPFPKLKAPVQRSFSRFSSRWIFSGKISFMHPDLVDVRPFQVPTSASAADDSGASWATGTPTAVPPEAPSTEAAAPKQGISMSEAAFKHLTELRSRQGTDLCLRMGVRQGGCSGMSYTMDFMERKDVRPEDRVYDYDGFTIVCDPKSLMYIFGLVLDYSDALIGGGFDFKNPNAVSSCGCGKSFST